MVAKRKKFWTAATRKMVAKINKTPLSKEEMLKFAEESELRDPEWHCVEGSVIIASQVFNGDGDKVLSLMFRMQALNRLVSEGMPGWIIDPEEPNDPAIINGAVFAATGVEPLIEEDGDIAFDREKFLRRVFQLAKELS